MKKIMCIFATVLKNITKGGVKRTKVNHGRCPAVYF